MKLSFNNIDMYSKHNLEPRFRARDHRFALDLNPQRWVHEACHADPRARGTLVRREVGEGSTNRAADGTDLLPIDVNDVHVHLDHIRECRSGLAEGCTQAVQRGCSPLKGPPQPQRPRSP